jgi:hypothetical protein
MRKPVDGLIKYHIEYLKVLDAYQTQSWSKDSFLI